MGLRDAGPKQTAEPPPPPMPPAAPSPSSSGHESLRRGASLRDPLPRPGRNVPMAAGWTPLSLRSPGSLATMVPCPGVGRGTDAWAAHAPPSRALAGTRLLCAGRSSGHGLQVPHKGLADQGTSSPRPLLQSVFTTPRNDQVPACFLTFSSLRTCPWLALPLLPGTLQTGSLWEAGAGWRGAFTPGNGGFPSTTEDPSLPTAEDLGGRDGDRMRQIRCLQTRCWERPL